MAGANLGRQAVSVAPKLENHSGTLRYGVSSLLRNGRCEYSVGELEVER